MATELNTVTIIRADSSVDILPISITFQAPVQRTVDELHQETCPTAIAKILFDFHAPEKNDMSKICHLDPATSPKQEHFQNADLVI